MPNKRFAIFALILLTLTLLASAIYWTVRPKRFTVAAVGFYDADNLAWQAAGKDARCRVETFPRSKLAEKNLRSFDAVILRTIGWRPEEAETAALTRYAQTGAVISYPTGSDLSGRFAAMPNEVAERIDDYLLTLTEWNASAFLRLLKREIGKENVEVPPPEEIPESGYFYRGPEISPTLDVLLSRSDLTPLPSGAPRVALIGPFLNPLKTIDASPVETLITRLEERGIRAVGIYGFKTNPKLLEAFRPDLAIHFPLGRVLPKDEAIDLFSRLDVPVLSAISLSVSRQTWEREPVGMTTSYQNLAVALPELDGVIEPTPISSLDANTGVDSLAFRTPLDDRIERLAERAARWLTLRKKSNAEKKLAFFYYRRPGAAAITAQSLDVVPSLYNTLLHLRGEGYDLGDGFPATLDEFAERLETEGRVIGQWAPGAFELFLTKGKPERVRSDDYRAWLEKDVPESARRELQNVWGNAPGRYFTGQNDEDGPFLAVSRIRFGNIVLLPQPTTAIIADDSAGSDFASVHGTNKAPPHFYLAAYLWAREAFQADALVHFGTHGSLEFTRGKSLLLNENDWPDLLVGDLPHVYLYSINNVGEALLAKRRTRAVLVSHLTPPFTEAGLGDDFAALDELIERYGAADDETVRAEQLNEVFQKADSLRVWEENNIERAEADAPQKEREASAAKLHRLLHQWRETAVTDGLHVIGRPWTPEQTARTAREIGTPNAVENLTLSTSRELDRLTAALSGHFIAPSTGGDPLVNPDSIPTGRNVAGIHIERTPDEATFRAAKRLTDEWLADFRASHSGAWPRRVALTLWGGEYLRTGGLTVAQGIYLLGARPVFDSKGILRQVEPIPSEELGRPRIDLLVQTSGQFRDAAPSRIELLDQAVRKIAALGDEPFPNYVRVHSEQTSTILQKDGFTSEEAAELATARIFGSTHALDYGTGIRRLVERSDRWESRGQIAEQYLLNMAGVYRSGQVWGVPIPGLLEANLAETDAILQSRSSNTWGPVKLDHLYEFGTLSLAVREKTGIDPAFTLTDARRPRTIRNASLADSVREELQTTLWNRRWLEGLMREGKSGSNVFPEMTQNLFGWSAVGPERLIDKTLWDKTYETLVADRLGLGMRDYFNRTNPAALADLTATMLDAVRKDFWSPSEEVRQTLAAVHAETIARFGPGCSYETCGNEKLREFIGGLLPEPNAAAYRKALESASRSAADSAQVKGIEMTETVQSPTQKSTDDSAENTPQSEPPVSDDSSSKLFLILAALLLIAAGFVFSKRGSSDILGK